MKKIFLVLLLFNSLVFAEKIKFYNPSFSCDNVNQGSIEYKICTNEELAKFDKELNSVYSKLKEIVSDVDKQQLIKEQKYFLRERKSCNSQYCIKNLYQSQIITLDNIYKLYQKNKNSKKLENFHIGTFIHPKNRNSILFVKELLKAIKYQSLKYTQFKNIYLFTVSSHKLIAGLYCANTITGEIKRLIGGFSKYWYLLDQNTLNIVVKSGGGNHGRGYEKLKLLKITDCSHVIKKTIVEYEYDMVSGFCGREFLQLKDSGDIDKVEIDKKNKLIKIDVREQKCPNGKIVKKILKYDLNKAKFIK